MRQLTVAKYRPDYDSFRGSLKAKYTHDIHNAGYSDQELLEKYGRSQIEKWKQTHIEEWIRITSTNICNCGWHLREIDTLYDRGYAFGIECSWCK